MEQDLRELIATVQNAHLSALLDRVLAPDSETWLRSATRPRPSTNHHAYVHGLLDHTLTVAQAVGALSVSADDGRALTGRSCTTSGA